MDFTPEQRSAARDALVKVRETRSIPFDGELREAPDGSGGSTLTFEGYACVTEAPYEMQDFLGPYTEVVRAGAFTKTLGEKADVAFLINHEGMTLARTKSGTMTLAEDDKGLLTKCSLDPANPAVAALRSAIDRRDVDEMSFAFRTERQMWSPDYDQRDLIELNLNQGDTSAVNFGANPHTAGSTTMRGLPDGLNLRSAAIAFTELRAGKTLSAATEVVLSHILELCACAEEATDEAQTVLADLLGLPPEPEDDPADPMGGMEMDAAAPLRLYRAKAHLLTLSR